jgi:hypothetical protein
LFRINEFFGTIVLLIKDYWFGDCGQSKISPVKRSIEIREQDTQQKTQQARTQPTSSNSHAQR